MFKSNRFIIVVLLIAFICYNLIIYSSKGSPTSVIMPSEAIMGQQIWQDNNCWSCHQIYGLGGYLGPDLTNVYSTEGKGGLYIKAFLNSGIKSMPKFNFSEKEKDAIVSYLKHVDSTGYYPNHNAQIRATGWVELKYKNEK